MFAALLGALGAAEPEELPLRLEQDVALSSCPGLSFHKVVTPHATYYLEKYGGGIAAMIDRDGNDWIGFRPQGGSRSAGEFRGFPNAVHQQAGNYFHPRNQSTGETAITVDRVEPDRISLSVVSGNRLWAGRYDFRVAHCTFTMARMPPDYKYWILYEGTPGGKLDDADWWITSAIREPQPFTTNHEGDIPAPEWIAFGDRNVPRVLFLLNHTDDAYPDRYYQMNREMTVFGFGRHRGEKHFSSVPHSFSIGFVESTSHADISRRMGIVLREAMNPEPTNE